MKRDQIYPSFFARFYDTIYHQMRDNTDHEYFMKKIKSVQGPVLEVGVGTGRFFKDAREQGLDIYGIDNSPAMIDVLKQKLPQDDHHRVQLQDFRSMHFDTQFDLIIAPFRVFMHLLTIEDQLQALKQAFACLHEGAYFIFDLFIPDLNMLINGLDNVKDFDGEFAAGKKVRRYVTMKADIINQLSNIDFRMEWEEDNQLHQDTWHTALRFFFRHELELLLKLSVFEHSEIYGDFDENPLDNTSKEFIVHCRK